MASASCVVNHVHHQVHFGRLQCQDAVLAAKAAFVPLTAWPVDLA